MILNERGRENVLKFMVEDRIEPDHAPISLVVKATKEENNERRKYSNEGRRSESKDVFFVVRR